MGLRFESTTGPFFWYRQSALVMYENRFFDTSMFGENNDRLFGALLGQSHMSVARMNFNSDDDRNFPKRYHLICIYGPHWDLMLSMTQNRPRRPYQWADSDECFFDEFTAKIRRIQRLMRRAARARIHGKRLALAMCMHERLGERCALQALGVDLLLCLANP